MKSSSSARYPKDNKMSLATLQKIPLATLSSEIKKLKAVKLRK
jgi:hypothetical protein